MLEAPAPKACPLLWVVLGALGCTPSILCRATAPAQYPSLEPGGVLQLASWLDQNPLGWIRSKMRCACGTTERGRRWG
jgi:hypothetical protein